MACVKRARRHDDHGHIDQTRNGEGDYYFDIGEFNQLYALTFVSGDRAVLRQARMQKERVRHNGRANNADGNRHSIRIRQLRRKKVPEDAGPSHRRDEEFRQIGEANDAHQRADGQFEGSEAGLLKQQQAVRDDGGNNHAGHQRHVKQ